MTEIRRFEAGDWPAVWHVIEPTFRQGDTYTFSQHITEDEARAIWLDMPEVTFVAVGDDGRVAGTYFLKPNQPGRGAHVCNCGYIVSERARGRGVASAMCTHSQAEAVARGYRAMQFNFVVSTNESAVRLWQRHGFAIVGTLPEAFRHPTLGFVDAFVMHKALGA